MKIDRAGAPFIAAAFVIGVAFILFGQTVLAGAFAVLAGFFCFFFRDPKRQTPDALNGVVSPADGRVVFSGFSETGTAPDDGMWQQISIFLSPLDVHVNRVPVSGVITRVDYRPGRFFPAYRKEAAIENERCEVWIDHNGQMVVCRQIVGILARRVICRVVPGMTVRLGQRLGIMKFGSRMDIFIPMDGLLQVRVGDIVRGGETILASLNEDEVGRVTKQEFDG
jgi:phosphatidylserine decarboxylase